MLKIDVFIIKTRAFDQEAARRTRQRILEENNRPVYLASPEDVILNKLEWYKMGGGVSDRQWKTSWVFSKSRRLHLISTIYESGLLCLV
jgi:hypothetical protein